MASSWDVDYNYVSKGAWPLARVSCGSRHFILLKHLIEVLPIYKIEDIRTLLRGDVVMVLRDKEAIAQLK
jgi:hypothetical protein